MVKMVLKWNLGVLESGWRIKKGENKKENGREGRGEMCYLLVLRCYIFPPVSIIAMLLKTFVFFLSSSPWPWHCSQVFFFYFSYFFFISILFFLSGKTQSINPTGFSPLLFFFRCHPPPPLLTWQLHPPPLSHHEKTTQFSSSVLLSLKVCCYLSFTDLQKNWMQSCCIVYYSTEERDTCPERCLFCGPLFFFLFIPFAYKNAIGIPSVLHTYDLNFFIQKITTKISVILQEFFWYFFFNF